MKMNRVFISICLFCAFTVIAFAQDKELRDVKVSNLDVAKNDGKIYVSMDLSATDVKLRSNQELVLTPILMTEVERRELPAVHIAGRNRYYRSLRDKKKSEVTLLYRKKDADLIRYQSSVDFEEWMQTAELMLEDSRCGCLNKIISENEDQLALLDFVPRVFKPVFVYEKLVMTQKDREASGSALIDFTVNSTEIKSNYRNNASELAKIYATIDTVKNNPDAKITSVFVKGHASPEGSYANNKRLAKERTLAIIEEIQRWFEFPAGVIASDYEPEDWNGLRTRVASSSLEHKEDILKVINSDMDLDKKDRKLRMDFPEEYDFMLNVFYPALRHSDYTVNYTVKAYTDVEEAKRVMKLRPGNLSLYEFKMVADSYGEDSEEYYETYNLMAMIYPENEIANLNAANTAMKRGELVSARKFLDKAGNGVKAVYARATLEALEGNYVEARRYFEMARDGGLVLADDMLKQVDELISYENDRF